MLALSATSRDLVSRALESEEEAWLLAQGSDVELTEAEAQEAEAKAKADQGRRAHVGWSGLKCALLGILAVGCILALAQTQGASQHQPSRFRHSLVAKFEEGLGHDGSLHQDGGSTGQSVQPVSLFWQCLSGSVPTACHTSSVTTTLSVFLLLLLCCVMFAVRDSMSSQAPSKEEQARRGDAELQEALKKRRFEFNSYSWTGSETDAAVHSKMQRAWDVSDKIENQEVLDEIVRILTKYPDLKLSMKGISWGNGEKSKRTEAAFYKDFLADFPAVKMEGEPYAQGRVLSIKRLLVRKGISPDRVQFTTEAGSSNRVDLTLM